MDSNVSNKKSYNDFFENIKILNFQNSILEENNNKFILSSVITIKDNNAECLFKILQNDRIWIKTFNHNEFIRYKADMGFDGSWKIFFKTMQQALTRSDGGDVSIKYNSLNLKNTKNRLVLMIFHPVSEDLKVKSEIVFDKFYLHSSEEFKNFNFDLIFELYESKNNGSQDKVSIKIENSNFNTTYNDNQGQSGKLEIKKNIKRKYISNLVNPNAKKRKTKGAKFLTEKKD